MVRDFQSRYTNSILGAVWSILNPLTQILIYTLVFSQVMRAKLPGLDDTLAYSIYICSGIITWQFFSEVLSRSINIFIEQGNLLKKASFPRSTLPVFVFLSAGINFLIIFGIFIIFLTVTNRFPGLSIIAVFPLVIIQMALGVGLGTFLGTLNVFFRDVGYVMGIILQFWFWLTPIVYPFEVIPEKFLPLMAFNPLAGVVRSYQEIFLTNTWPEWLAVVPAIVLAGVFLVLGYITFLKLDKEMVDEL
ncbi:ABC transporter permease [Desulfitobacterium sp. PCE1]|uniref:ABC transporter permease n=1 Tax=Desulfitobacterium sp. PCE1 TaxID=146907 RepID=UPI0003A55401|nr:ABC transporter permease [Desulfitobacterium sp. PCE1]